MRRSRSGSWRDVRAAFGRCLPVVAWAVWGAVGAGCGDDAALPAAADVAGYDATELHAGDGGDAHAVDTIVFSGDTRAPDGRDDTAPQLDLDDDAFDTSSQDAALPAASAHTSRGPSPGARLLFSSNVPATTDACALALVRDLTCEDLDHDGLSDAWEQLVLEHLRPTMEFDEEEPLLDDPAAVVVQLGRVFPASTSPLVVHAFVVHGYARDYGTCFGASSHNGDPERVALELARGTDPQTFEVVRYYTAAHEHTAADHSQLFAGDDDALVFIDDPQTGQPRWRVYPSAGKHATYASVAICEAIAPGVPCMDEDCGADAVDDPSLWVMLPPFVNVGEPGAPLVSDLSAVGFPGDDAWADQPFCGGLDRNGCSSPLLEKLTTDPFL